MTRPHYQTILSVINKILFSVLTILTLNVSVIAQDSTAIVSAFFGLDNALPLLANVLCIGASGMDGMPLNFNYPIDASSLSETDFEVIDSLGNSYTPFCAVLAPANEIGENRTVLLVGEFGTAVTNPPVRVNVVDDLFTINTLAEESACSEGINLNGSFTTNVVPLIDGPSLFFAQKIEGSINDCGSGTQTVQVVWNGGITPYINGDSQEDLYQYYTGFSDSSGVLITHQPIAIADINDNDNFHQLCFATNDQIVKISMTPNTVQDPNLDPNLYNEIEVTYCETPSGLNQYDQQNESTIYPNPIGDEFYISNLMGNEVFILYDSVGRIIKRGRCSNSIEVSDIPAGIYYLTIVDLSFRKTLKMVKK